MSDEFSGDDSWSIDGDVPDEDSNLVETQDSVSEPLLPTGAPPREGERFGSFAIIAKLGAGGMGTVFQAEEAGSGRPVALKTLAARRMTVRQRERFRREGELTANLSHPGIVKIHSAGEINGIPYLAYELVEGGRTIGDVLREGPRALAVALLRDVAEAVGYAHASGVVHRDLKPDNILIDTDGKARVADFGLAWSEGQERLTRTGALVGTPLFMAPEQFHSEQGTVGPATDVWAVGVMLYTALTGKPPFTGKSLVELASNVVNGEPRPPREVDPSISADLQAVCLKALEGAPEDRYPDGAALAADLSNALRDRPVDASAERWQWRRRRRYARKVAPLALLVLVVLGAISWEPSGELTAADLRLRGVLVAFRRGLVPRDALARELQEGSSQDLELRHRTQVALAGSAGAEEEAEWRERLAYADAALKTLKDPTLRAAAQLARGRAFMGLEAFAQAEEALTVAARLSPGTAVLLELGESRLRAGRPRKALEVANQLAAVRPGALEGMMFTARVQVALGEIESARRTAATCLRDHPGPNSLVLMGHVEAGAGADPQTLWIKALKEFPADAGLRTALAEYLLLARDEAEAALAWCRDADPPDARLGRLTRFLGALTRSPPDLAGVARGAPSWRTAGARWLLTVADRELAFLERARSWPVREAPAALSGDARRERAREALEACLASSISRSLLGRAHLAMARLEGLSPRGREHLGHETVDGDAPWTRCLRAEARLADGDAEEAWRLVEAPSSGNERFRLRMGLVRGRTLLALGRTEDAAREFESAAGRPPLVPQALDLLRQAYTSLGRDVTAIDERLELLAGREAAKAEVEWAKDPGAKSEAGIRLAWSRRMEALAPGTIAVRFELGKELFKNDDRKEGLTEIVWALRRDPRLLPDFERSLQMYAHATLFTRKEFKLTPLEELLGRLDLGSAALDRFVSAILNVGLAEFYRLPGAELKALADLNDVLADDPAAVVAWTLRGFVHLRLGRYPQAERDLRVAAEESPDLATVSFYQCLLHAARGERAKALAKIKVVRSLTYPPWRDHSWTKLVYPEMSAFKTSDGFDEFSGRLGGRQRSREARRTRDELRVR